MILIQHIPERDRLERRRGEYMMRLDKFLADAGLGTRTEVKAMIRQGRVTVDGTVVKKPEQKVSSEQDVCADGTTVRQLGTVVLMLHKPSGYVTSTSDPRDQTVMELLPAEYQKLFPVGRLDKETEGLLLFTNDGELGHRLTSPRHCVEKEYYAETDGEVTAEDMKAFSEGIALKDGTMCRPAGLERCEGGCLVTVQEGKYHQVRRMLASRGKPVKYLRRIREGALTLGTLKKGECRLLTPEEISNLL